jgi:hypothetical protein
MKNGLCPKCGSAEVYRRAGDPYGHELITLKGEVFSKGIAPDKYLCGVCGYLEYYVSLQEDIQIVRENWQRIPRS